MSTQTERLPFIWDYDLTAEQFVRLLREGQSLGRLDQAWAAARLLEYGSYADIRRLMGFRLLVQKWPEWREAVRSRQRRDAFDFLVDWLPQHHPELLQ